MCSVSLRKSRIGVTSCHNAACVKRVDRQIVSQLDPSCCVRHTDAMPSPSQTNSHAASPESALTYKGAGVDIEAGDALVERIKPLARATRRAGMASDLGGFGGLFDLRAAGYTDPILVSGTDGVGTKLKLAFATGIHNTIGIDLVAMCANDVLAQGAEPLFFLDYFATGQLDTGTAESVIAGIAEGCLRTGCALLGGETAEMPGMYAEGHYDLAGFVVGAVERDRVLPYTAAMREGDVLIALPASGPHSNGYSLIRRIVERSGLSWTDPAPFAQGLTLGQALLTPTALYARTLLPLIRAGRIKGLAHITGGGLPGNVPRMLPESLEPALDWDSWQRPAVWNWLQETGGVPEGDMRNTFNLGAGIVLCVDAGEADNVLCDLSSEAVTTASGLAVAAPWIIGTLVPSDRGGPIG